MLEQPKRCIASLANGKRASFYHGLLYCTVGCCVIAVCMSFAGGAEQKAAREVERTLVWFQQTWLYSEAASPHNFPMLARIASFEADEAARRKFLAELRTLRGSNDRAMAAVSLAGFMRSSEVDEILESLLLKSGDGLRLVVIQSLVRRNASVGPETASAVFADTKSNKVRFWLMMVLGGASPEAWSPFFARALQSEAVEVREYALEGAPRHRSMTPIVAKWLRNALENAKASHVGRDPDHWRYDIVKAIEYLHDVYRIPQTRAIMGASLSDWARRVLSVCEGMDAARIRLIEAAEKDEFGRTRSQDQPELSQQ